MILPGRQGHKAGDGFPTKRASAFLAGPNFHGGEIVIEAEVYSRLGLVGGFREGIGSFLSGVSSTELVGGGGVLSSSAPFL